MSVACSDENSHMFLNILYKISFTSLDQITNPSCKLGKLDVIEILLFWKGLIHRVFFIIFLRMYDLTKTTINQMHNYFSITISHTPVFYVRGHIIKVGSPKSQIYSII